MKNLIQCQKCKSTENLTINSKKTNGEFSYLCKKCNTERFKKYRKTKNGKEKIYKAVYKSMLKYPEKQKARMALFYKIKIGEIIKPEICEVCLKNKELVGHHIDYSKPLDVEWVCRDCHNLLHKILIKIN